MQVTIPQISVSEDGSFTLYHVQVRVAEKVQVIKKRYSEFVELRDELESMFSVGVPYRFPRKTLFRNTVKNPQLAEERRRDLELFLQNIAEDAEDIKWKKSLPFKEFLNLPPGIFSNVNEQMKEKMNDAWSLTNNKEPVIDLSTWIEVARECRKKLQSARRDKKELVLIRAKFEGLSKGLVIIEDEGLVGEGELNRRKELLNSLKREYNDIEQLSVEPIQLFKGRVIGKPKETDRTRGMDNQELLQMQKQDFKQQDEQLEELSKALQRQKELGVAINEELSIQNEILDELDQQVESSTSKLHYAQKRVGKFT